MSADENVVRSARCMRPVSRAVRLAAAAIVSVVVGSVLGSVAAAHSDIDYTSPADGDTVDRPVTEIVVAFADTVTVIGSGFEVLDPQGQVSAPAVSTDDDRVFRLLIDPALAGGDAAVRYEVRAVDGHTITGGFSFTVTADRSAAPAATQVAEAAANDPASAEPEPVPTTAAGEMSDTEMSDTEMSDSGSAAGTTVASETMSGDVAAPDDGNGSTTWVAVVVIAVLVAMAVLFVRIRLMQSR